MQSEMISLAIVPLIIWVAVFAYLLILDKKISAMSSSKKEDDL